ncbi:hypothetical protein [Chryseobacterium sp. M5A1_1a]
MGNIFTFRSIMVSHSPDSNGYPAAWTGKLLDPEREALREEYEWRAGKSS